jgi:hypothetical protein
MACLTVADAMSGVKPPFIKALVSIADIASHVKDFPVFAKARYPWFWALVMSGCLTPSRASSAFGMASAVLGL